MAVTAEFVRMLFSRYMATDRFSLVGRKYRKHFARPRRVRTLPIYQIRISFYITRRWFGLILLPIVSFAADGAVAVLYFGTSLYHHFFRTPMPPISLAKARAIDLSVQFSLFWMPFLVLLAWWTNKPFGLLFGMY
jgi:hypothetical protein